MNGAQNKKQSFLRRGIFVYVGILILAGVFSLGFLFGSSTNGTKFGNVLTQVTSNVPDTVDVSDFWKVWNTIQESYVDQPVDEQGLLYGAMDGLVKSLDDPYSTFFTPEQTTEFEESINGTFSGIGAEIATKNEQLQIVSPLVESPAEKAGLLPGDAIKFIDDVDTGGMTLSEAVARIRGEEGTQVTLKILRGEEEELREFIVTRAVIHVKSVKFETKTTVTGKKVSYIQMSQFSADTTSLFDEAIRDYLLQETDGVILDLRNNPGGFLSTAIEVGSEFIEDDVIVLEEDSSQVVNEHKATGSARLKDAKIVLLVNGGSASASEIVAGAVQDYGKGTLIGEQTYGKGSVQDITYLDNGSSIKLTIARWLTPKGRVIDDEGIVPDIVVELTEEDYDNDRDPQLDRALEFFDSGE